MAPTAGANKSPGSIDLRGIPGLAEAVNMNGGQPESLLLTPEDLFRLQTPVGKDLLSQVAKLVLNWRKEHACIVDLATPSTFRGSWCVSGRTVSDNVLGPEILSFDRVGEERLIFTCRYADGLVGRSELVIRTLGEWIGSSSIEYWHTFLSKIGIVPNATLLQYLLDNQYMLPYGWQNMLRHDAVYFVGTTFSHGEFKREYVGLSINRDSCSPDTLFDFTIRDVELVDSNSLIALLVNID